MNLEPDKYTEKGLYLVFPDSTFLSMDIDKILEKSFATFDEAA